MPQTDHDRAVALAGLFQAVGLVRDLAHSGQLDSQAYATCVDSLFMVDAADSSTVYGGVEHLRPGLDVLRRQLAQNHDPEITRYALLLLVLERKLARKPQLLSTLRSGIEQARSKRDYFTPLHDNIIAHLAELYANTVSTLKPRVMVNGHYSYLSRPENANRIRTLLLAGVRAAVLWRQSGGNRLTLLLGRKRLQRQVAELLSQIEDDKPSLPDNA